MSSATNRPTFRRTTILCARRDGKIAMGGDGQVTMGDMQVKGTARKIHRLHHGKVLAGFAGATADAFALLELFEKKLEIHQGNLLRSAEALSRDWRTDRILRRLEAMLVLADESRQLVLSGLGDVLEPEHDIAAIGSGGGYAAAAARAFMENPALSAREVVERSLAIAADLCVYTNANLVIEELPANG